MIKKGHHRGVDNATFFAPHEDRFCSGDYSFFSGVFMSERTTMQGLEETLTSWE